MNDNSHGEGDEYDREDAPAFAGDLIEEKTLDCVTSRIAKWQHQNHCNKRGEAEKPANGKQQKGTSNNVIAVGDIDEAQYAHRKRKADGE